MCLASSGWIEVLDLSSSSSTFSNTRSAASNGKESIYVGASHIELNATQEVQREGRPNVQAHSSPTV